MQHILHHLEGHPNVRGDALHKDPLLLERLLQARVCSLWVLTRHPGQSGHQILPDVHLLPQPAIMRRIGPNKAPKLEASRNYLKDTDPEEGLHLRGVPGRHNQDALGRLQELSLRGTSHHQVIQVSPDPLKDAARPRIIRVPGLGDAWVGLL